MTIDVSLKREHMLQVNPFRQTPGLCGWASLKMVLDYNGIDVPEKFLFRMSGNRRGDGARADDIIAVANCFGFMGVKQDCSTIADIAGWLSMDVPVIVDYFDVDDGHYAVVAGIREGRLRMQDPQEGRLVEKLIPQFEKIWFDYEGLKPKKDTVYITSRLIAIYDPFLLPGIMPSGEPLKHKLYIPKGLEDKL